MWVQHADKLCESHGDKHSSFENNNKKSAIQSDRDREEA